MDATRFVEAKGVAAAAAAENKSPRRSYCYLPMRHNSLVKANPTPFRDRRRPKSVAALSKTRELRIHVACSSRAWSDPGAGRAQSRARLSRLALPCAARPLTAHPMPVRPYGHAHERRRLPRHPLCPLHASLCNFNLL